MLGADELDIKKTMVGMVVKRKWSYSEKERKKERNLITKFTSSIYPTEGRRLVTIRCFQLQHSLREKTTTIKQLNGCSLVSNNNNNNNRLLFTRTWKTIDTASYLPKLSWIFQTTICWRRKWWRKVSFPSFKDQEKVRLINEGKTTTTNPFQPIHLYWKVQPLSKQKLRICSNGDGALRRTEKFRAVIESNL
jgi:hypothetical protein